LPSSMLSNGGIYSRTRDVIFKYFYVKAIVELGSGTFMETGTNTAILFLERRPDSDHEKISQAINAFFTNKRDVAISGIEKAFSTYVTSVYEDLSYGDYLSFINENPNDAMLEHELCKDYKKEFGDNPYTKAFEVEKEKMLYFFLSFSQTTVIVKSGQKQDEKAFLGYEFSKRRGHEGIKFLPKGTLLYDEDDFLNRKKVSSYIYSAFNDELPVDIDESLTKHISCSRMSNLVEYGTSKFVKRINLRARLTNEFVIRNKEIVVELGSICDIISGQSPESEFYNEDGEGLPFYQGKTEFTDIFLGTPRTWTTSVTKKAIKGDIVMSVRAPVGPVNFVEEDICIGRGLTALRCDESKVIPLYVFYLLLSMQDEISGRMGMAFDSISRDEISALKLPVPPLDIQRQIVSAFENANMEICAIKENIQNAQNSIITKFLEMFGDPVSNSMDWKYEPLSELGELNRGISKHRPRNAPELLGGEHPLIQTGEVAAAGLYITSYTSTYSDVGLQQSRKWPKETLCITIAANIAKTAILDFDACFPDSIVGFIADDKVSPIFMHYWFSFFQKTLEEQAPQLAQKNINLQILRKLKVIVPPIELQNEFAEYANGTTVEIQNIQQSIDALSDRRNEILNKYL